MDQIKLGYTRCGDPQGRPLCLIHGWGLDSSFLSPVALMFSERDVYLIDLPGYGKSRDIAVASSDYQGAVQALADTIPAGSDVMAFSMGALYAIKALTTDRAAQATSLITICSNSRFPRDPNWPGFSSDLLHRCRTMLTPNRCRRLLHLFIKLQLFDGHGTADHAYFFDRTFRESVLPDYKTLMDGINIASYADVREDLQYLKIPCLQLYGAHDRLVPAALTYALKSDDLRSSYIFVNSAHNPYITEAELFEKVVREFFDKVHTFLH